jgi:hypothetical protein
MSRFAWKPGDFAVEGALEMATLELIAVRDDDARLAAPKRESESWALLIDDEGNTIVTTVGSALARGYWEPAEGTTLVPKVYAEQLDSA